MDRVEVTPELGQARVRITGLALRAARRLEEVLCEMFPNSYDFDPDVIDGYGERYTYVHWN